MAKKAGAAIGDSGGKTVLKQKKGVVDLADARCVLTHVHPTNQAKT